MGGLQSYGVCVLITALRVGGLQNLGECALATTKRGGLQSFGEWIYTIPKLVVGLQSFVEWVSQQRVRFNLRKACTRHAEFGREALTTEKRVG